MLYKVIVRIRDHVYNVRTWHILAADEKEAFMQKPWDTCIRQPWMGPSGPHFWGFMTLGNPFSLSVVGLEGICHK